MAGVHKYAGGKHRSHFLPLPKVAQYFAGYKRSTSTLNMQCSSGKFLTFIQYSLFESTVTTSHFNLFFAKRNLVLRYKFAFRLTSFSESGSREEGVIFHGIGVGSFMIHLPEYSNAFCGL